MHLWRATVAWPELEKLAGGTDEKAVKPKVARELRKNMTDAERFLWARVRKKQLKNYQFYRQKNIGNYIVDFYCPAAKLIVEVDGGHHYESENIQKDKTRDNYLGNLGFTILRFSDRDIFKNIEGVLQRIYDHL
jgi:very-short-patch-repair endonuclease